ncbi:hypothetical protein FEF09_16970 [Chitinophaga pinensis]|uniref:Cysteine-rich CPCC domain-containing protein n=2 Tax=Chitinophaga pinensis TaxID=79329 RepID=A0A5C6LVQ7_9BACT|nr:hypothetical protein FEF09_16970 [Chitinophaga pinensis]
MYDALSDAGHDDSDDIDDAERNRILREYLQHKIASYRNSFIEELLVSTLKSPIKITGVDVQLFPCPCCGYSTLKLSAEYFICAVCYWEDDGTVDKERISSVNGMSLGEGKVNFQRYGVVAEFLSEKADKDRFAKYYLSH